jgi:hypothetical protein
MYSKVLTPPELEPYSTGALALPIDREPRRGA